MTKQEIYSLASIMTASEQQNYIRNVAASLANYTSFIRIITHPFSAVKFLFLSYPFLFSKSPEGDKYWSIIAARYRAIIK